MFQKENFKEVEIGCNEKFLSSIKSHADPQIFTQEEKETFIPFLVKYFEITAYNCMILPVYNAEIGNVGYLIFIDKNIEKERFDFNKRDEMLAIVCASVTRILFYIEDYHYDSRTVKTKIWKINNLLTTGLNCESINDVIKLVEERLPDIYGCHRSNIYLCDHKRQEIYKIVEQDNKEKLIFFSSQSGIAGKISNEGKALITNNVITYFQFNHEIDDPNGKYHHILKTPEDEVVNILTVPVYCFTKELDNSFQHFPIAVIQLINKINKIPFLKSELEDIEKSVQFLGQIVCKAILKQ